MEFGDDSSVYQRSLSPRRGWFWEQRTRFISGSGSIRNARVDRFPIGFPPHPLPLDSSRCTSRASNTGACVILKVRHRRETDSIPFCGFLDTHRFCKISVRPPRYYFGRELLRGRPIDSDRRTREAFNNGERVSRFSVSRMRVVVMLIYNLAIRVVF